MMQKERSRHGDGDGSEPGEFTVTVRQFGGAERKLKVRKMTLKEFLKRNNYEARGYAFTLNGKQLELDENGELKEDPVLHEDAILEMAPERITGGW